MTQAAASRDGERSMKRNPNCPALSVKYRFWAKLLPMPVAAHKIGTAEGYVGGEIQLAILGQN